MCLITVGMASPWTPLLSDVEGLSFSRPKHQPWKAIGHVSAKNI